MLGNDGKGSPVEQPTDGNGVTGVYMPWQFWVWWLYISFNLFTSY